jgi:hypothetical protein
MTPSYARDLAIAHAQNLRADIVNSKDRIEHIRLTRLAEEAESVANALVQLVPFEPVQILSVPDLPTHY